MKESKANFQARHFYTVFENEFKNFLLIWQRMIVRFVIYVDWDELAPF